MIDVSAFTQEQQWGLAFVAQQACITPEEYAANVLKTACDSYYQSLVEYKKTLTIEAFNAAPPEKQAQVFQILEVPDVVGG